MLKNKGFIGIVAAMLCVLAISVWVDGGKGKAESISYPAFVQALAEGKIRKVYYSDEAAWTAEKEDGTQMIVPNPRKEAMKEEMLLSGIEVVETGKQEPLPILIFLGIAIALFAGKRGKMEQFALTEADQTPPDKTFEDVIISRESRNAMEDLILYLKNPESYTAMGARPPRGVLLYGPPGTGKTLIAQALAGETGKPFYAVSGSDFVQVYVGVGASRIRSLFKKARKAGGGVIFIDEIDALGKKRDNGNEEREQTLNALLTEMNGFSVSNGIIVLAATNRPETLDAALLREGRFDRRIEIGLPDAEARRKILTVHTKNKPLAGDVDLETLAGETVMFSGAQLESLVNEAAIRAIRARETTISHYRLQQALIAQIAGEERPMSMSSEEKRIVALHEAGHALATYHLLPGDTLSRVTIIPSSRGAAGYSYAIKKEQMLYSKTDLLSTMAVMLAGRAAEEMVLGAEQVTNGAGNDLEKAKEIARQMYQWHMTEGDTEKEGVEQALKEGERKAAALLAKERAAHERLTRALLEKETLTGEEIRLILTES